MLNSNRLKLKILLNLIVKKTYGLTNEMFVDFMDVFSGDQSHNPHEVAQS